MQLTYSLSAIAVDESKFRRERNETEKHCNILMQILSGVCLFIYKYIFVFGPVQLKIFVVLCVLI